MKQFEYKILREKKKKMNYMKKKMAKKTKNKKSVVKFIDNLETELRLAKFDVNRGSWNDYSFDENGKRSENPDDFCEWVIISLREKNGKRYQIEFYFDKNSTRLINVQLFKQKRKKGWKSANRIASTIDPVTLLAPTEKPRETKKEDSAKYVTSGTSTIMAC